MACIQVDKLRFSYEGQEDNKKQEVLRGITLQIDKGDFVAIVGHNGSGKSTLAKHFNALLLPSGGRVYVDGMDTLDEAVLYEIRRRVGLVLQNPDNQMVASVVEEDVAFGPENLGMDPDEIRRRVDEALKQVGMYEYRTHAPYKLSGGQKQRIAIAGIIAMQPDCIILDEPTAMLDPRGRQEVLETIHMLNQTHGITIILITHYMEEAVHAKRVIVMERGIVLADGTPRQVFARVKWLRLHKLDVPQATELVYKLRATGAELPDVLTAEECVQALKTCLRKEV